MKRRPDLPPGGRGQAARGLTTAAAEGRLRLAACAACGALQYPARETCRDCLGDEIVWADHSGFGTVLAATTLHHTLGDYFRPHLPLRTGSIALDGGPVVIAYLCRAGLEAGMRARVFARLDRAGEGVLGAVFENDETSKEALPMANPNCEIAGRTVLVSGANGGIGRELVAALSAAGARRIIAAVRQPATHDDPRIEAHALDLTVAASIAALAEACAQDLDIVINNAGVNANQGLLDPDDDRAARAEMEVNYFGTLAMARAFAPAMKRRGQGVIVNMLTVVAHANLPLMGSYCASKAAELSLTQGLRAELMPWGVRVVGIFPGAVDTAMSTDFPPPKIAPRQVADAVVDAITTGIEDSYVGPMAHDLRARLAEDPKAVERDLAAFLPEPR